MQPSAQGDADASAAAVPFEVPPARPTIPTPIAPPTPITPATPDSPDSPDQPQRFPEPPVLDPFPVEAPPPVVNAL